MTLSFQELLEGAKNLYSRMSEGLLSNMHIGHGVQEYKMWVNDGCNFITFYNKLKPEHQVRFKTWIETYLPFEELSNMNKVLSAVNQAGITNVVPGVVNIPALKGNVGRLMGGQSINQPILEWCEKNLDINNLPEEGSLQTEPLPVSAQPQKQVQQPTFKFRKLADLEKILKN